MIGHFDGTLRNGYGTGSRIAASGTSTAGTNSYTESDTSILKLPDAPGNAGPELYVGWAADNWDFGTSEQLPILKYNKSSNSNIACLTAQSRMQSDQPLCNTFLPDQNDGLRDLQIEDSRIVLDRAFASEMTDYVVSFSNDAPNLAFRLRAYESDLAN